MSSALASLVHGGLTMSAVHHPGGLNRTALQQIAAGKAARDIDDMEFFETLAHRRCLVMPPWIYHIEKDGHLKKVTPVQYTVDYRLDKASILLALIDKLRRADARAEQAPPTVVHH